jgi:hypothetical protein
MATERMERWTQEHHLTPHGWALGTLSVAGMTETTKRPRPDDVVETWLEVVDPTAHFSENRYCRLLVWHLEALSESEREVMRLRFPLPFIAPADAQAWRRHSRMKS